MRALLHTLKSEPLVYFLAAGFVVFAAWDWWSGEQSRFQIVVSQEERERIAAQWEAQMGRPPNDTEMSGMVDDFVREEVYYQEALRMGLDQNDTVIRRRLAQKLTFLTEDLAAASAADQEALDAFYTEHIHRYTEPEKYSFTHHYFSAEQSRNAKARAAQAVNAGNRGEDLTGRGDPFLLESEFRDRTAAQIAALLGEPFATSIATLPEGGWHGPVRSAFGWHAVLLEKRTAQRVQPHAEVQGRVLADYAQQVREAANESFYAELKQNYRVVEE